MALYALPPAAFAQKGMAPTTILVGGGAMVSDRDVIENLGRSADHTVFLSLLQAAGVTEGLRQRGAFTIFAPTDAAFAAMPPGELDSLRHPENKAAVLKLIQCHIIPGDYSSARLHSMMRSNKGVVELGDIAEGKLTVINNGPSNIALRDAKGTLIDIVIYDVKQANGVVYVIDRVLSPG